MYEILKKPFPRAVLFIVVLVLLIVTPWWISLPIIIFITLYLPLYLEVLFFGFVLDTLYSARFSFPYTFMTASLVLLLIVTFVRSRIRT